MNTARTPLFYMANLGAEVSRALLEYQKEDYEKMENSIIRAKDIMTKIEEFPEMKSRTGELEILKSIIEDLNQKKFELDKDQLISYFSPFAMRLMSLNNIN
jgi:hypothetical protein